MWINDGVGIRKFIWLDEMMVSNKSFTANLVKFFYSFKTGNAIINGNDQMVIALFYKIYKTILDAIRFNITIGDEIFMILKTTSIKELIEYISASNAVWIVMAENNERLVIIHSFFDACSTFFYIRQQ